MVSILAEKLNFKEGKVDSCFLTRVDERETVMIALYVDDGLCIRDKAALKELEDELNEASLKTTIENKLNDYLSCKVKIDEEKNVGVLRQLHLIKNLEARFGKLVKKNIKYQTPDTTRKIIGQNKF